MRELRAVLQVRVRDKPRWRRGAGRRCSTGDCIRRLHSGFYARLSAITSSSPYFPAPPGQHEVDYVPIRHRAAAECALEMLPNGLLEQAMTKPRRQSASGSQACALCSWFDPCTALARQEAPQCLQVGIAFTTKRYAFAEAGVTPEEACTHNYRSLEHV